MRVLVANKFWYQRGGSERVMFDEIEGLTRAGHEVVHFSTNHPANEPSSFAEYFAPYAELGVDGRLGIGERAVALLNLYSNREARRRFARLLDATHPDVVHVHGIHRQLSPSILVEARQRGLPVVQTLHDYHHVCPADVLLLKGTAPCVPRRCGRLNYLPAVANRCHRGSTASSALSASETGWQRLRGVYERTVQRFISPSRFLAATMRAGGWDVPVDLVPNAVALPPDTTAVSTAASEQEGPYFLVLRPAVAGEGRGHRPACG